MTVDQLLTCGAPIEAWINIIILHCILQHREVLLIIVEQPLSHGAFIEATNKDNNTPLHLVTPSGLTGMVKLLLKNGASIEATDTNNTPLHLTTRAGLSGMVELILQKGASVEATDKNNNTPLHLAAPSSHMGLVGLLVPQLMLEIRTTVLHCILPHRVGILVWWSYYILKNGALIEVMGKYHNSPRIITLLW